MTGPPVDGRYRVRFRRLDRSRPIRSTLLVLAALLLLGGFLVWLMLPSHWPSNEAGTVIKVASIVMTVTTGVIGVFAFLNLATLCRATLLARDPIPVRAEPGRRVAFVTTIVPSAEPIELVVPTLEAALQIRYEGEIDVWLLDEGNDPAVRETCARLGVSHFSRRGAACWNTPSGRFKTKSKHGNWNAWLDAHGEEYEFVLGVDPDHVPLPNFAERLLGYFRDPDVAFVVGPQVYGNYQGFVVRAAESQQFLFHSLLQRAGNRSRSPMLVGTNNALRVSALRQIGGFQDSITEDMATGLALHGARNPKTARRWTSVYTPDVVAVGEGPVLVHRLLQPAGPLVTRHRRGPHRQALARGAPALAARPRQLLLPALLLPDRGGRLGAGGAQRPDLLLARGRRGAGPGSPVADALPRRRHPAGRPLLLQPPPQRQPARGGGLGGDDGPADLGPLGPGLLPPPSRRCCCGGRPGS